MELSEIQMDKTSPVPIYFQLKQGLEQLIESGRLTVGEPLPSENELSRAFHISPMTVRRAMSELVNAGYVYRERGRGTFVAPQRMQHQLENLTSFTEDMRNRNLHPSSRILLFESVPPPEAVAARVALPAEAKMTRIKRLRFSNETPVGVHDSYLNVAGIDRDELEAVGSLYSLLESKGIIMDEGDEAIEAVAASAEVAGLLNVPAGAPLLQTTRFSWDRDGHLIEYVVALYHADLYRYTLRLKRSR